MTKEKEMPDRQISSIVISTKGKVKISFNQVINIEPEKGEEESSVEDNEHTIKTTRRPHEDFIDAFKRLRPHAFELCEMQIAPADKSYQVTGIYITGDMLTQSSECEMVIAKKVKRTEKSITWKTGSVTMYGESDYKKADQMTKLVEALIKEAWRFLEGKSEHGDQIPLFPNVTLEMA